MSPKKKSKKEDSSRPWGRNTLSAMQIGKGDVVKYSDVIEATDRLHKVSPGDQFFCECCKNLTKNPKQHMYYECAVSQYYILCKEKMREAYLYLLQRSKEWPDTFHTPGRFVMFKASITKRLMKRLSPDVLFSQDDDWNVLMPITTDVGGLKKCTEMTFFDHLNAVLVNELGCDSRSQKFYTHEYSPQSGESVTALNLDWNLHHDTKSSSLVYTHEEQITMEITRFKIVKKWQNKVRYPLMCVHTAKYGAMKEGTPTAARPGEEAKEAEPTFNYINLGQTMEHNNGAVPDTFHYLKENDN